VKLPPLDSATIRVVDNKGKPVEGATVSNEGSVFLRPTNWLDWGAPLNSLMAIKSGSWKPKSVTDATGEVHFKTPRFTPSLLPAFAVYYRDPQTGITLTTSVPEGADPTHTITATLGELIQVTQVTAAAVTFTDKDGTAEDTYTIPATKGVDYLIGEKTVEAGTHPGTGTLTVTAKAQPDYILAAGTTTEWTTTFKSSFIAGSKASDLNSDGKADLLAWDTSGALWLYPGNGKGSLLTRTRIGSGWNVMTSITGTGDLNSDGKADLLARDTSGALWLYPGNGKGSLLTRTRIGSGWNIMTSII
jgi:hypothetical protein